MKREEDRRSIAVYYIHTLILDNINSTRVPFKYLHVTISIAFRHLGPLLYIQVLFIDRVSRQLPTLACPFILFVHLIYLQGLCCYFYSS